MEEIKTKFEEIKKLCEDSIPEYGENSSYFGIGDTEEEILSWETQTGVKMPETYREWLKLTKSCRILNNVASFYLPEIEQPTFLPEDYIMIGNVVGDGEVMCFSKKNGSFMNYFEGKTTERYDDFDKVLQEISRMITGEGCEISKEAEALFWQLVNNAKKRAKLKENK